MDTNPDSPQIAAIGLHHTVLPSRPRAYCAARCRTPTARTPTKETSEESSENPPFAADLASKTSCGAGSSGAGPKSSHYAAQVAPVAAGNPAFDYGQLDAADRDDARVEAAAIVALSARVAGDCIDIGERLLRMKARLGHGRFTRWVRAEAGHSPRRARAFMRIARRHGGAKRPSPAVLATLAADTLDALAAAPEPLCAALLAEAAAGRWLTAADVRAELAGPAEHVEHVEHVEHGQHLRQLDARPQLDGPPQLNAGDFTITADGDDEPDEDDGPTPSQLDARRRADAKADAEAARFAELAAAADPAAEARRWTVTTGDCLAVMDAMPAGCCRLVFADPPYNIGFGYGPDAAGVEHDDRMTPAAYADFTRAWTAAAARLLADDGTLWVMLPDALAYELAPVIAAVTGLRRLLTVIWRETFGPYDAREPDFTRTHRHLLRFARDPRDRVFDADAVRVESARQRGGDARANPRGKVMDSVWDVPRLAGNAAERVKVHRPPTQLPLELVRPAVVCSTRAGDLVCDPFAGTGTTAVAAVQLGRRFAGAERNPRFADVARGRVRAAEAGPAAEHDGRGRA